MTRHPQAGDGIVDLRPMYRGQRHVVDGIAVWSHDGKFRGVLYTNFQGDRLLLTPGQYRRETFAEYLTRPTGFGRTSWVQFAIIQAACIALVIAGVVTWSDGGWVACAMAATIEAVLLWQSHRNYTGKTR